METQFHREYLLRLPLPVAQLYSRAYNAKDARSRHDNCYYLFEVLIKLSACPLTACYVQEIRRGGQRVAKLDQLLLQLAFPSLGQWMAILRETARHYGSLPDAASHPLGQMWGQLNRPQHDPSALAALYRRIKNGPDGQPAGDKSCTILQLFEALVQYRNGVVGHGAGRFESFYANDMGPLLFPAVNEILAEGVFSPLGPAGARLAYLTELRAVSEDRFELGMRELTGAQGERMASLALEAGEAAGLAPNRAAVLWPGLRAPLRLDPLMIFRESEVADEVLLLNGERGGRQVEYLSYTTGRTERTKDTAAELAALLSILAGKEVTESKLQQLAELSRAAVPSVEALTEPAAPVRRQLGDYEILAEIGRGGMGVVYLARQLSLGRLVALKTLPADLAGDEVALARFRREMRALSRCDHPNIVKLLDSGVFADGQVYYTMEYVAGCDLDQVWHELSRSGLARESSKLGNSTFARAVISASGRRRKEVESRCAASGAGEPRPAADQEPPAVPKLPLPPLPPLPEVSEDSGGYVRKVVALIRDAALALQAVHDQGIVHRDISPANLMLTPDGSRVVLMDFGLVKGQNLSRSLTEKGGFVGKLRYAAPEQLAAAMLKVGPQADVRGLGVTLWELLTRHRLFEEAHDERQLTTLVHEKDVPRLRQMDSNFDRDLEAIVARATERNAGDRIESAGRLAEYLQLYLDGKPLPIRTPTLREMAWRWSRAHKPLVGAAAAVLVIAAAGLAWWWRLPGTLSLDVSPADAQIEIAGRTIQPGEMPLQMKLPAGVYQVRIRKDGFADEQREVAVLRGGFKSLPRVSLIPYRGTLGVQAWPPGTTIEFNGVDYAAPIKELSVDTGVYDLRARADECFDALHTVRINRDQRTEDRFSLERGFRWKEPYTSPAIQSGVVIVPGPKPGDLAAIVHNEIGQIVFLSAASGELVESIPTPAGNMRTFTQLDLGGDVGKVIVSGFEDETAGPSVLAIGAHWPAKTLWEWQGPAVHFGQAQSLAIIAVPRPGDVAQVAVAGRDGRVRLLDGRTGTQRQELVLSDAALDLPPMLAAWTAGGETCLAGLYRLANPNEPGTGHGKLIGVVIKPATGDVLWRWELGAGQNAFFADLDRKGIPRILLWNDRAWQAIDATTGAAQAGGTLSGPLVGGPGLADAEGRGADDLIFQFVDPSQPMLAVRPDDGAVIWQGPSGLYANQPRGEGGALLRTADGALLVALDQALAAVDARSGKVLWQAEDRPSGVLVDDARENIYVTVLDKGLVCLDSSGKTRWTLRLRQDVTPWALVPSQDEAGTYDVLLHRHAGLITLVHGPRLLWEAEATAPLQAAPLVATGDDGKPVVIQLGPWGDDVNMRWLDGACGITRWSDREWFSPNRPPTLAKMDADGVACVVAFGHPPASDGIYLVIHRASDGKVIRSLRTDLTGWMSCAPAVADFRGVGACDVAVSCWDARRIAMIDGRSGATLWYQPTEQPNMGGIAAGDLGGGGSADVVATSLDGHVYALRGKDGKLIWKTTGNRCASWSPPTIAALDDQGAPQVLVTTVTGQLFVLDGRDGKELWSPDVAGGGKVGGRAVVAAVDGRSVILAPMGSAGVVAFDWPSRKELWRSPEGHPVITASVVADFARDGKRQVVVAAADGDVFVLDLVTGNPLWHMKVAQGLIEADPVVADLDGGGVDDILIASHDSHLYAISGKKILDAMHRRAAVSRPVK